MKKILLSLVGVLLLTISAKSEWTRESLTPVWQSTTTQLMTLYTVGGTTTSACTFAVFGSSIEFKTTGGLYPGSTWFMRTDSRISTVYKFIDFLNGIPTSSTGTEGGVRATYVNGGYLENPISVLTEINHTNCLAVANTLTLSCDSTYGLTYLLNRNLLSPEQQFHITDISLNITFPETASCWLDVYDGSTVVTTSRLRRERIYYPGIDAKIDISGNGYLENSENTFMRFDIWSGSAITGGWLNFTGFKK